MVIYIIQRKKLKGQFLHRYRDTSILLPKYRGGGGVGITDKVSVVDKGAAGGGGGPLVLRPFYSSKIYSNKYRAAV